MSQTELIWEGVEMVNEPLKFKRLLGSLRAWATCNLWQRTQPPKRISALNAPCDRRWLCALGLPESSHGVKAFLPKLCRREPAFPPRAG